MTFRHTAVVLTILAGLVLCLFLIDGTDSEQQEAEKTPLFELDFNAVDSIELSVRDKGSCLIKREGNWKIKIPLETDADSVAVESILRVMESAVPENILGKGDLSDYGLDPADIVCSVADTSGNTAALSIGMDSPIGPFSYAFTGGDICLIDGIVKDKLSLGFMDLRHRGISGIPIHRIESLSVDTQSARIVLKKDGSAWNISEPLNTPADTDFVNSFLADMEQLEAHEFISENASPEELKKYGFGKPLMSIKFADSDEIYETFFQFTDDHLFAHRKSDNRLMDMETMHFREEYKRPDLFMFRMKNLMPLSRWAVDSFHLKHGETEIKCAKDDALEWKSIFPENLNISIEKINEFLEKIGSLKATGFIDNASEIDRHGFEEPLLTFTAWSGEKSATFKCGKIIDGKYAVKIDGVEQIFLVPDDLIRGIMIGSDF